MISLYAITSFLLALILSFVVYIGAFRRIKFEDGLVDSCLFVFRKGAGAYKDLHGVFKFVCDSKQKYNLQDCKVAGIYYDDPETIVLPRYAVGFLVESKQMAQMNAVKKSLSKDYQFLEIKKTRTICATFPIRAGFLSYALSAMKVYPAFKKRLQVRLQSGVMEIYHGNLIATHFPVEHFDLFLPRE